MKTSSLALLLLASMAFVLLGCSDTPPSAVDPTSAPDHSSILSKVVPRADGTIPLQGFMRWDVYGKKEHKVIVDPMDTYTLCAAQLNFTDKQTFVLHTTESFDNGDGTQTTFREIFFNGTMTPSGKLKFTWPEKWLELNWETGVLQNPPYPNVVAQIRAHTGYDLSGPGVNKNTVIFEGSFDGTKFFADCHVVGFQKEPGSMGPPYDVVVDGPITFIMSIELKASN